MMPKEGSGEPHSDALSDQHYLQKGTSSEPRVELLLVLVESDKPLNSIPAI
jgi:hypothetical protein